MKDDRVIEVARSARRSTNGWWRADCPFCPASLGKTGGETFALRASGGYYCLRCGISGRVWEAEQLGLGEEIEAAVEVEDQIPEIPPPEGFMDLSFGPGASSITTEPARLYLEGRQIGPGIWERAGLGVVLEGYYGGRVVVPVKDREGRWLGWVARDYTGNAERKYLYPRGMARGQLLYQQWVLERETDRPCLLVEGTFDALPYLGRVVAALGKPGRQHIEILSAAKRPVVVVLDGDAWREAEAVASRLRLRGVRAGFIKLPPKTDPCDLARKRGRNFLLGKADRMAAVEEET